MKTQIVKWGSGLGVRIPKAVVAVAKFKQGDAVEIEAVAEGHIELRRPTEILTLAQLVSKITPENRYAEVSTGGEVGKERGSFTRAE